MRNKVLPIVLLVLLSTACQNKTNSPKDTADKYQCPMKCTDEVFDKPGKCSVCEMDLEKINN